MDSQAIRQAFLNFFAAKNHARIPSSPLVPAHDPTLLFTNAGMVQFKDVFLGADSRSYTRATTVQKCIRAGGKHNDLENVGFTARHHTFFEMLGNFSFGDYFKRDAIHYAWELLTVVFKIPAEKLWITVFEEDDEALQIWTDEVGVDKTRISRIGAKDNFWMMGDTGPCGPCSEIFYDHGEHIPGGPPGTPEGELDRYIEIWNLVFMQYNRDASGQLSLLPKPSVDTGMGLERIAAVLQGVHDNYEIDSFKTLIAAAAKLTHTSDLSCRSLRVMSDHVRSTSFLIAEGVMPGNEGRGYVLRRIIRRAIRHGYLLGMREPFFYQLAQTLTAVMGEAYPELKKAQANISKILKQEEEQFLRTLSQGMRLFDEAISTLKDAVIPGEVAFKLYDTYGFPVDLTEDMAHEYHLKVDMIGFEQCMEAQRERARQASKFNIAYETGSELTDKSRFEGYFSLSQQATLIGIYDENRVIVLDHTPFYPEGGGQVGDRGVLKADDAEFIVTDTQKKGDAILHIGYVKTGRFQKGAKIDAHVDIEKRRFTARNHSATHLLHAALQKILGLHVEQKGSYVADTLLRFDFSHSQAMTDVQKVEVEQLVNLYISNDYPVEVHQLNIEDAKKMGAMALFGEKYGEEVRVLQMGDVSIELCGGTHVKHSGEIGLFKIISESGIAAGTRRIEAVTSLAAQAYLEHELNQSNAKVLQLEETLKVTQKLNENLQLEMILASLPDQLLSRQKIVNGVNLIRAEVALKETKQLNAVIDALKNKLKEGVIVLVFHSEEKTSVMVAVTPELSRRYKANDLLTNILHPIQGKGGGRPELAQGGGSKVKDISLLWAALEASF